MTTRSATAQMLKPESGIASGRWRRRSLTDLVIRLCGTFASASACAVRSTIRSWNENSHALRGPRAGDTNSAAINARIVLRGRPSSFSTSPTPYGCIKALLCVLGLGFDTLARRRRRGGRLLRPLGRLARFSLWLARLGRCRSLLLEAGAQRFHEVDDLRASTLGRLGQGDLLAFYLLLHRGLDARAHLVSVYGGVEDGGGLLLDQHLRELELGRPHLGLRDLYLLDRSHLAGVEEVLHDQALLDGTDHHDVLLAAGGPAPERAALGLAQRACEQREGRGATLVRGEVVRRVAVNRVDRFDGHEFGDFGRVRADLLHRLQLLGTEHHVLVLGEFIAFDHVLARDRDLLLDAEVLLLQARPAALVQQVERDRAARLGGRIELHRNRHQPERNRQRCYRSCSHVLPPTLFRPWRASMHFQGSACGPARRASDRRSLRG